MGNLSSIIIGVVSSFIASIIFLFTAKFIKRKSQQFLDWVYSRSEKLSNKYYSSISKNRSSNVEFITAFSVLFLFYIVLAVTSIKVRDQIEIHKNIIEQIQNDEVFNYDKYIHLFDLYEKQQHSEDKQYIIEHFWFFSFLKYFLYAFTIMFTLFGYFAIFRGFQIREANRKFNRQLDIISPYIKSKEILILKSKWARMESRIDYLA